MALIDVTFRGDIDRKKDESLCAVHVPNEVAYGLITAANNYEFCVLPECDIQDAWVMTYAVTAANAITIGTTATGSDILTAGNTATLGSTGTFGGKKGVPDGTKLYFTNTAAITSGRFRVVVKYAELGKGKGERTRLQV